MLKLKKIKNSKGKLVDITVLDDGKEIIEPSVEEKPDMTIDVDEKGNVASDKPMTEDEKKCMKELWQAMNAVRGRTANLVYYDEGDKLDEEDLKTILPLIKEADTEDE